VSAAKSALLIVDDNEDNRYTLTRRLQREGCTNVTTAVDGPLALVKNGDRIRLNVPARTPKLKVSAAELAKRRKAWRAPRARPEDRRG